MKNNGIKAIASLLCLTSIFSAVGCNAQTANSGSGNGKDNTVTGSPSVTLNEFGDYDGLHVYEKKARSNEFMVKDGKTEYKIVLPESHVTLLDSLNKRIDFLKEVCADLGLNDVECIHGRAEEFAANHREDYDIVTSRAVANLQMLSELCLPLVKVGGYFLSMKAVDSEEEVNAAKNAIKTLGGQIEKVVDYAIPGTDVRHRLIFIKKIKETPKKYPRAFAKIKKNPL